jgi:ATP-binding protein involved in chromosome partitioning
MSLPQFKEQTPKDPIEEERERLEKIVRGIPLRIGVHAGKGGVGKTFIATQLAMAMAAEGKRVGLIDADVDCPNIPEALGLEAEMRVAENGQLLPVEHGGVLIVSTGFMQKRGEPLIIRGPIKHRLLTDFVEKVEWGELDVLVFDFPPGTSDVPLSAMQVASLTGLLLVSTPARSAIADFERAAGMAKRLSVPVYGAVENMAGEVFGQGTVEKACEQLGIRYLTSIPLSAAIREKADQGEIALPEDNKNALLSAF